MMSRQRSARTQTHIVEVKHGQLRLKMFVVELLPNAALGKVTAKLGGKAIVASASQNGLRVEVNFGEGLRLNPSTPLEVTIAL